MESVCKVSKGAGIEALGLSPFVWSCMFSPVCFGIGEGDKEEKPGREMLGMEDGLVFCLLLCCACVCVIEYFSSSIT